VGSAKKKGTHTWCVGASASNPASPSTSRSRLACRAANQARGRDRADSAKKGTDLAATCKCGWRGLWRWLRAVHDGLKATIAPVKREALERGRSCLPPPGCESGEREGGG
jgi:hypothetical protein